MNIKIPSKFQLGGSTIKVKYVNKCFECNSDTHGQAIFTRGLIELVKNDEWSNDYKEQLFLHELVHHIFNAMSEGELANNEKVVDQFATYLHQALKTME